MQPYSPGRDSDTNIGALHSKGEEAAARADDAIVRLERRLDLHEKDVGIALRASHAVIGTFVGDRADLSQRLREVIGEQMALAGLQLELNRPGALPDRHRRPGGAGL